MSDFYSYREDDYADNEFIDEDSQRPVSKKQIAKAEQRLWREHEQDKEAASRHDPANAILARSLAPQLLALLTDKERWVLTQLSGLGQDGREYGVRELAEYAGISHTAIAKTRNRALDKMKRFINENRLPKEVADAYREFAQRTQDGDSVSGEDQQPSREGRARKSREGVRLPHARRRGASRSKKDWRTRYHERLRKRFPRHLPTADLPETGSCILCKQETGNHFDGRWMCWRCEFR